MKSTPSKKKNASSTARIQKAANWVTDHRVTIRGDWAVRIPNIEPSGWSFEFKNSYYPDVDDTAMVSLALSSVRAPHEDLMQKSLDWLLSFQCRDGGWAAFDKDVQNPLRKYLPFADHRAILDPSCLKRAKIDRGIACLLDRQGPDGAWDETLQTGTGFPSVLYLRYDYYRIYWPLRALAIYASCLERLKGR